MKAIRDLVDKAQQTEPHGRQNTTPASLPASWVSALFAKLRGRYGHQWISRFGSAQDYAIAQKEWAEILGELSGEDIKRGLDTWRDKHPPNVFEFLAACKPPRQHAAHRPFQALPPPERHIDVQAEIRKLRRAVRPRQPINRWQEIHGMRHYA